MLNGSLTRVDSDAISVAQWGVLFVLLQLYELSEQWVEAGEQRCSAGDATIPGCGSFLPKPFVQGLGKC